MDVTKTDLQNFEQKVKGKLKWSDKSDFEIINTKRRYTLYWQANDDHFNEDPSDVASTAVGHILDESDYIARY